jgi:large subunit ribosomal protein L22
MEVRAHLRHLQLAPRKVRVVIDVVRGLSAQQAVDQLEHLRKEAARPVRKLIQSAMANAKHNFQLENSNLYIKSIIANEGPRLKRYRPRAFGRAAMLQKRQSHITVVLEDRPSAPIVKAKAVTPKATTPVVKRSDIKNRPAEPKTTRMRAAAPAANPAERRRSAEDVTVPRKGES